MKISEYKRISYEEVVLVKFKNIDSDELRSVEEVANKNALPTSVEGRNISVAGEPIELSVFIQELQKVKPDLEGSFFKEDID